MSTLISKNKQFVSQKASIINPDIELIGVINNKGKMVNSIGPGSINMSKDKKEMFFMKIALRNSMQKDFDEDLGEVDYCITQRGGTKYISIPTSNCNTILVVTKTKVNHEKIVKGINQILLHSQEFLGEPMISRGV